MGAIVSITQLALLFSTYYIYWAYARKHLASELSDKDLVFWTGQGETKAGFFFAEVDGNPVGTVAYLIKVGLQLGLERATLETDSGTLVAIKFYNNTGWTEELRYPWYYFRWIHGTELI